MSPKPDTGLKQSNPDIPGPRIEFRLLGALSIRVNGVPYRRRIAGPARELLVYLLSHPERGLRREALPEAIWGELRAPTRGSFNTTLWRLKKFLTGLNGPALTCSSSTVRFSVPESCAVDSRDLRRAADRLHGEGEHLSDPLRAALIRASAAWRGSFAEGEPSDWLLEERERMHDAQVRVLIALMRDAGVRGRYDEALEFCHDILRLDPFRETIHCEMLWLLVLTGQRARALQCHDAFRARLIAELDIAPMVETTALYRFIRSDLDASVPTATSGDRYAEFVRVARDNRASIYAALRPSRTDA